MKKHPSHPFVFMSLFSYVFMAKSRSYVLLSYTPIVIGVKNVYMSKKHVYLSRKKFGCFIIIEYFCRV